MVSENGVKSDKSTMKGTRSTVIPIDAPQKRKPGRPKKSTDEPEQYISFHLRDQERIDKYEELSKKLASKDSRYKRTVNIMRYIIDLAYKVEIEENGSFELDNVLDKQIKLILANDFLQMSYHVSDMNTVVNKAVEDWLKNRKSDINLHNWDFRKHLEDEEKRVAMAFIQNQLKPEHFKGLTMDDMSNFLTGMDVRKIRQVIRGFLQKDLVEVDIIDGIDYYYAPLP